MEVVRYKEKYLVSDKGDVYKENKKLTSRHTKIFETFERFRCKNKQKRYSKNGKYGKNAVKSCKFVDKKRFQ